MQRHIKILYSIEITRYQSTIHSRILQIPRRKLHLGGSQWWIRRQTFEVRVAQTKGHRRRVFDVDEERIAAHVAGVADAEDGGDVQTAVDEGEGTVVGEPVLGGCVCDMEDLLYPGCALDDGEVRSCHFLEQDYRGCGFGEGADELVKVFQGAGHAGLGGWSLEVDVPG